MRVKLSKQDVIALRWVSVTVGGNFPVFYEGERPRLLKLQKKGLIKISRNDRGLLVCNLTLEGKDYLSSIA